MMMKGCGPVVWQITDDDDRLWTCRVSDRLLMMMTGCGPVVCLTDYWCVTCRIYHIFLLFYKRHDFSKKKLLNIKCVLIFSTSFLWNETFLILRRIQRDIAIYVQGGLNMTGTNCDLFTHNQSRSYLNHLVHTCTCKTLTILVIF
jgi:hypothetical protein